MLLVFQIAIGLFAASLVGGQPIIPKKSSPARHATNASWPLQFSFRD